MNKMTHDEMLKYSAELVVKNNPDEAVKLIILFQQENELLRDRISKAIEILQDYDLVENKDKVISDTFKALRGEDKPEYLGYSDKECINCGRLRVEKYSDGTEICEKCNFDQNKKEYTLRGEDNE